MRPLTLTLLAGCAVLAACQKPADKPAAPPPPAPVPVAEAPAAPAEPELTGFAHDPGRDVFGYYTPQPELKVGNWKFVTLSLGGLDEFKAWEGGKREATFAPVMIQFEDVTGGYAVSPETGGEYAKVQVRVLPEAYSVKANAIHFRGRDAKLGVVTFDGEINPKVLAEAQADDAVEAPVVTGTLKVGDKAYPNLKFTWFGGD